MTNKLRRDDDNVLQTAAQREQQLAAAGDSDDDLLEEEARDIDDASATVKKKIRRAVGFATESKEAPQAKKAPRKKALAKAVGGPPQESAPSAAGQTQTPTQTVHALKSSTGRGSASNTAELDPEMKVVAKHHLQTDGSSTKALENLTVEFFLGNPEDSRYPQSAKLRGVS